MILADTAFSLYSGTWTHTDGVADGSDPGTGRRLPRHRNPMRSTRPAARNAEIAQKGACKARVAAHQAGLPAVGAGSTATRAASDSMAIPTPTAIRHHGRASRAVGGACCSVCAKRVSASIGVPFLVRAGNTVVPWHRP